MAVEAPRDLGSPPFERYEAYLLNDTFHMAIRSLVEEESASEVWLCFLAEALLRHILDKSVSVQMSIFCKQMSLIIPVEVFSVAKLV